MTGPSLAGGFLRVGFVRRPNSPTATARFGKAARDYLDHARLLGLHASKPLQERLLKGCLAEAPAPSHEPQAAARVGECTWSEYCQLSHVSALTKRFATAPPERALSAFQMHLHTIHGTHSDVAGQSFRRNGIAASAEPGDWPSRP